MGSKEHFFLGQIVVAYLVNNFFGGWGVAVSGTLGTITVFLSALHFERPCNVSQYVVSLTV
jgi:hypothetical protein